VTPENLFPAALEVMTRRESVSRDTQPKSITHIKKMARDVAGIFILICQVVVQVVAIAGSEWLVK
jgi:hypothetical protein